MKVFVEEQRFKKWVLLVILLPILTGIIPLLIKNGESFKFNSEGFWGITIVCFSILLVFILIFSIRLNTKINEQGIYFQFFPNHFSERFISWSEIENCAITKQKRLLKKYGYKKCFIGKNKGITMNLGGKSGFQLELKNGKHIFIGTQKPLNAEKILEIYKHKLTTNG